MKEALVKFLIFLDGAVYDLIGYIYEIFLGLAKLNLFSNEDYQDIVSRIYVILGMVMLFFLAYTLLKAVINPDDFSKGEMSAPKLIKNIISSLIIIAVLPMIFTYAFNIQNALLNNNTITKIVLGSNETAEEVKAKAGRELAFYFYRAFLYPEPDFCKESGYVDDSGIIDLDGCSTKILGNGSWFVTNGRPLTDTDKIVLHGNASFRIYSQYSETIRDGKLHYTFLISTLGGAFILYVLANFCFDLALRVIKLMFYQMIAPIAVICRVVPTGKIKDVFNNWLKATVSTFFEVFVRVFILTLGVYMVHLLSNNSFSEKISAIGLTGIQGLIARALLLMGLVMFIKSAPKLISDIFGVGNIKLGLKEKLADGGFFTAGAAVGAGAGMFARNAVHAVQNFNKAQGGKAKTGAVFRGIGSTIAGTASGFFRGGYNARNAKSQADARNAMSSSVQRATLNRSNRERYRAQHAGDSALPAGFNVLGAHISDNFKNATEWAGIGANLDALNAQKKFNSQIIAIDDNSDSVAADLMNRDVITGSQAIMSSKDMDTVTKGKRTYKNSLAAMRETLKTLESTKFEDLQGQTLEYIDTKRGSLSINTREDYAEYMAQMRAQLGQAERDMKKFIKLAGYKYSNKPDASGETITSYMEGFVGKDNLGGGEVQRFAKLASDAENVANLVAANQNSIEVTNKSARDPGDVVSAINSYIDMDKITNNAKNSNIDINATIERMTREKEARNPGDKK